MSQEIYISYILQVNGKIILKSGTDFFNFSKITLDFVDCKNVNVNVEEIKITEKYEEDLELKEELHKYICEYVTIKLVYIFLLGI